MGAAVDAAEPQEGDEMRNPLFDLGWRRRRLRVWALAGALALWSAPGAAAPAATPAQQHFASQQEAAAALVAAARSGEDSAFLQVLGPEAKRLLHSGDPVADRAAARRFVEAYERASSFDQRDESHALLQVGEDAWPLPIPLVKDADGWRFDTAAGAQEMLARRIGRNELTTIQACLAFVDAQYEYYRRNPEGSPLLHYAARLASTSGKRDGLYWEAKPEEPPSPLGALFARARAEGYRRSSASQPAPYHGYMFKLLTGQGPHAAGGAYDYLVRGKLLGGFALVAYPARYGSSGVMTFLVNHQGVVFQKDLGPETAKSAAAMTRFDPDESWKPVPKEEEAAMGEAPAAGG